MKNLKTAVEECMVSCEKKDGGEVLSRFVFADDFIGFQGHFPGNKILPGICQIQCVLSTVEQASGKRAELREIVLAKFTAPVLPNDEMVCLCRTLDEGEAGLVIRASFTVSEKKIGEMKLKMRMRERNTP